MKKRIISAAVGILLTMTVLFFYRTSFYVFVISGISVGIIYELLVATKYSKNFPLSALSLIFAAMVPFFDVDPVSFEVKLVCFSFGALLFVVMLIFHNTVRLEQIGLVFFISVFIPFSMSTLLYVRERYTENAMFYIVAVMVGAWTCDMGAYFVGTFFGKHKLAPKISPKKTVEGAIGGIAVSIISITLWCYAYIVYKSSKGVALEANLLYLFIIGFVAAVVGMLGDLFASLIKRQCAIKDFGNIMPGHGGIFDRFDSIIFVAPVLYLLMQYINPLSYKI